MTHRYKPVEVQAFRYNGQADDLLPDWVRDYEGFTQMGKAKVGRSAMNLLLLPIADRLREVQYGEWLVLDNGKIMVVKQAEFGRLFAEVEPVVLDIIANSDILTTGQLAASDPLAN